MPAVINMCNKICWTPEYSCLLVYLLLYNSIQFCDSLLQWLMLLQNERGGSMWMWEYILQFTMTRLEPLWKGRRYIRCGTWVNKTLATNHNYLVNRRPCHRSNPGCLVWTWMLWAIESTRVAICKWGDRNERSGYDGRIYTSHKVY